MRNKFLKMTFMALCLSTSSVVHAMEEEGEIVHAPVLFSGEYEIEGAGFLEPEYGSVTVHQFDESKLALQVNLNDSPELRLSKNPNVLQPLLKLSESDSLDNLVALFYNDKVSDSEVTRYYGEKTVDGCNMEFEFEIKNTPNSLRLPGEKGIELWIRSNLPQVARTLVMPATELDFGVDLVKVMPTIHLILKKMDA